MNVSSHTVRLFLAVSAFTFFFSCSDQLITDSENPIDISIEARKSKRSKGIKPYHDGTVTLINYYNFNDQNDPLADAEGNYDLLNSTADFTNDGYYENALSFDKKKYVQISNSKQRTGNFHDAFVAKSYSIWFKASQTNKSHFIIEEGGRINSMGLRIRKNHLMAAVTTRGQRNKIVIKTPFTDTENWHHAAVVFDNGQFSLYLDGNLIETKQAKFDWVKNHPNGGAIGARYGRSVFNKHKFKLCKKRFKKCHKRKHKAHKRKCRKLRNHKRKCHKCRNYVGGFFKGSIDEVKIFSGALTSDMISEIFTSSIPNNNPPRNPVPGGR